MSNPELAQEWRERLEDYAQSQMTVQAWCEFNGVTPYQYYYWRRRFSATTAQKVANGKWQALAIVEAVSLPATKGSLNVRIAGAEIKVKQDFDPSLLRAVVAALRETAC